MKLELAEKIVDACQNSEVEASLRENYSGRGMFGETTTGVVVESLASAMAAILCSADEFVDYNDHNGIPFSDGYVEPSFFPCGFNTDSMGHDTIIY